MIRRSRQQIGAFLKQGAWFGGLPESLQEKFVERSNVRTFARGQLIQTEEGSGVGMTAILDGSVRFLRHVLEAEPTLLHVGGPGFWFGHMNVLEHGSPVVSAVVRTTTEALVLTRAAFTRLAAEDGRLAPAVTEFVYERMRLSYRFLAQAQELPADERLRVRLADLADLRRLEVPITGTSVELDLTQSELAEIVRLSRQQVNARLQVLQGLGLLELGQRRIRVLDSDRLRRTA
jgi:CRP-like cAMP-binding protein